MTRPLVCVALVLGTLFGCAAANPEAVAFQQWAGVTAAQAEAGQIPHSSYYAQAYSRLERSSDSSPEKYVYMRAFSDMLPVARAYEAGQISAEQFEDAKRATRLFIMERSQAMDAQRQQAIAQAMHQAANSIRGSVPVDTTCSQSYGFVNCRSR